MKSTYKFLQPTTWPHRLHRWHKSNIKKLKKWRSLWIERVRYGFLQAWVARGVHKARKKAMRNEPIRVAFLVMYATSNQHFKIFEIMRDLPNLFDPVFIVNPDVFRSKDNRDFNYNRTKQELVARFGEERVLDGVVSGRAVDFSGQFDLMTTNNPYELMAAKEFQIEHWSKKGVPVFYTSYFYMGRCRVSIDNIRMPVYNMFWRFYAENEFVMQLAQKNHVMKGRNFVLSGSPKMDDYGKTRPVHHARKRVIIAPHHSIGKFYLCSGGFLEYASDILELVKTFRDIDFVFRPHPLLFETVSKEEYWGRERAEKYWATMRSQPNVIVSTEGDYLQEFADSDGMIHDCGSFAAEYMFTGKPCAYYLREDLNLDELFTELGRKCVASHYQVRNYEDISKFIESVIIQSKDEKQLERNDFAKNELMYNYPRASEFIVSNIMNALGIAVGSDPH